MSKPESVQASGCQEMHFYEIKENVEKRIAKAKAAGYLAGLERALEMALRGGERRGALLRGSHSEIGVRAAIERARAAAKEPT